jgi:hypothetical protein
MIARRSGKSGLRRLVTATAFALVSAASGYASASPTARLSYVRGPGAETCPDEDAMRRAVATRLGYDPFRVSAPITLSVSIRRTKETYAGEVKLVDDGGLERGARTFESRASECAEIAETIALSMSIAVDPQSALAPPKAEPPPAEEPEHVDEPAKAPLPEPRALPPPVPLPKPAAPPESRKEPVIAVGIGAHGAAGIGPAPAFGLTGSGELRLPGASLGLGARVDFPSSATTSEGGRANVLFAGGEAVPCFRVSVAFGCGVLLLGGVRAESFDVTTPRSSATFFAAAGARAGADVPLGRDFALRLAADLLGHFTTYGLAVNGRSVFTSSSFSGKLGASLVRFF